MAIEDEAHKLLDELSQWRGDEAALQLFSIQDCETMRADLLRSIESVEARKVTSVLMVWWSLSNVTFSIFMRNRINSSKMNWFNRRKLAYVLSVGRMRRVLYFCLAVILHFASHAQS